MKKLIGGASPMISSEVPLDDFLQPASLDLPIGNKAYRMPVSTVPRPGECITDILQRFAHYDFIIPESGALLDRDMTYVIPLAVSLNLSNEFSAHFSSKSTSGRNDQATAHLTNGNPHVNVTTWGYKGQLYIEVTPLSWNTRVYPWKPLSQIRFHGRRTRPLSSEELAVLHSKYGIVRDKSGTCVEAEIADDSLYLHVDLEGERVGHESIRNPQTAVHLGQKEVDVYDDFFRPVKKSQHGDVILHSDGFYLLATQERILIPPEVCAVMEQYSTNLGEFSSHEAGFFDNNFGGEQGTQGVLEVHVNKRKSIRFWHGRPICRMVFYRTDEVPEKLYGRGGGSHYVGSGPSLPKNIREYWKW